MNKPKYCPFRYDINQMTRNIYEYNEDGQCVITVIALREQQNLMKCHGKECAAWRFGKCQRKS